MWNGDKDLPISTALGPDVLTLEDRRHARGTSGVFVEFERQMPKMGLTFFAHG
jgi:hypothetical protein